MLHVGLIKKFVRPIFFSQKFYSDKNGTILVSKFFGSTDVMVGGCFQSGRYINRLFRKMLRFIPREHPVKEVLLLGLGGGSAIQEVKKRFHSSMITAVEYDPIMIEIAKTIYLKPMDQICLQIIVGDAREVVSRMNKKFDLVIVDLFFGRIVPPMFSKDEFVQSLSNLLKKDGYLAMNFFLQKNTIAPIFDRFFSRFKDCEYSTNEMAIYRHFGEGFVGDPMPHGYIDKQQSKTHLGMKFSMNSKKEIVGLPGCLGARYKMFSLFIEDYASDIEPVIDPFPHPRLINWQPLTICQKNGWHRNFTSSRNHQYGIGIITEENKDQYFEQWSSHAQRHREKWLRDERYKIVDVTLDEFVQAYHASKKLGWLMRNMFVRFLKDYWTQQSKNLRLFGVRDIQTNEIVAGLAVVEFQDIAQSFHTVSFIHDKARKSSIGVGLIEHWYASGIAKGIRFFNFGIVWREGDPKSYKGYSKFKRQFNLHLMIYPEPLFKFVRSNHKG